MVFLVIIKLKIYLPILSKEKLKQFNKYKSNFTANFTSMKNIFIFFSLCLLAISCNSTKNTIQQNSSSAEVPSSNLQLTKTMLQSGIDFFAQGSQPTNWQLTTNYDDTVRFKADDGLALKFAYNQLKKEFNTDKTVYSVKLKAGEVIINILDKICTVPTMREVLKNEVTVSFNTIIYTGCGKFLADDRLNNKWILEKIGNTFIKTAEYNKAPVLAQRLRTRRHSRLR